MAFFYVLKYLNDIMDMFSSDIWWHDVIRGSGGNTWLEIFAIIKNELLDSLWVLGLPPAAQNPANRGLG